MKPLIYGYLRVDGYATDDDLEALEEQMRRFAEVEGFCYASTFYEDVSGSRAAFEELTNELKRAEARHVVVPSLTHLSVHPLLLNHLIERLEVDANAQVLTPSGA